MAKIDGYQGFQETAVIPIKAKDQGDLGGEVCEGEVYWSSGNSSPKFLAADNEIQSRSVGLIWCLERVDTVSVMRAGSR
jgi:hypothetical protein